MRIVVLGAGTVGLSIADLLCSLRHSITVVDNDAQHLSHVNERLDVRVVRGSASESSVLFQADVLGADLCLAVTGDDEVNLVAASMAKAMGARRTIARVYAPIFRDMSTFDYQRHFRIDRLLSLEHLSAIELSRGVRSDGMLGIKNIGGGQLEAIELTITDRSTAVGIPLKDLNMPPRVRVGSVMREGQIWIAGAADELRVGDRISLLGRREDIEEVRGKFQKKPEPKKNVAIAGGGETGYHLARMLDDGHHHVVLMEVSTERCEFIANHLQHVTVVHADGTRRDALEEERVGAADIFVACTGDDENNIMAGVEAREIGSRTIMAIVGRPDYANVVGKLGIDLAVSPRDVMAKQVLSFLTTGPIVSRTELEGGEIEVLEIEITTGAPVTEHVLADLSLPGNCLIAAVVRQDLVCVPAAQDRLRVGDSVVALVERSKVEALLEQFNANGR